MFYEKETSIVNKEIRVWIFMKASLFLIIAEGALGMDWNGGASCEKENCINR